MATRPSTSGQSEGGEFTCHLLPTRSLLLQEHRYPHSRRPAETRRDVQRAEQCCLATQLGSAGQGASGITGGDLEGSGDSGMRKEEGVETELRQLLGRSCFSSLLGPHCGASHLSLLQPTEQDSTCPRREH